MLYQPPGFVLFFLFGFDLAALALLYFLVRSSARWERVLLYGSAVLLILFSSFLKLLYSEPAPLASTPSDLQVENRLSSSFQTFYYLDEGKNGHLEAYWKEHMLGRHKTRMLEMEGFRGLLLAKKIDGQWQYQRVLPSHLTAVLDSAHFHPDTSGRVARAVWGYFGVELSIYLSELLTLAALFLLVYRLPAAFRKQPDIPYINVVLT
ncbi:hypothetical protein MUN82_14395 [Hymenobacter aerilatus]|uniref:Uncharacterized protein n=1 Tax=Hymenobacter aerilatus TaxID=2932251 RepID=A0A8T9SV77_9BACT|nr:hypothetical protein [Hymenobacter aerilatus]UOR04130.1 hypothetical protein MUN82_14395 [Hymenobacter aerilatus]